MVLRGERISTGGKGEDAASSVKALASSPIPVGPGPAMPFGGQDRGWLQTYPRLWMSCPCQLRGHPLRVHQGLWREREERKK